MSSSIPPAPLRSQDFTTSPDSTPKRPVVSSSHWTVSSIAPAPSKTRGPRKRAGKTTLMPTTLLSPTAPPQKPSPKVASPGEQQTPQWRTQMVQKLVGYPSPALREQILSKSLEEAQALEPKSRGAKNSSARPSTYHSPVKQSHPHTPPPTPQKQTPLSPWELATEQRLQPRRIRKKKAFNHSLQRLADQQEFPLEKVGGLAHRLEWQEVVRRGNPHRAKKSDLIEQSLKIVAGIILPPLGAYFLLRDTKPTAVDIAARTLNSTRKKTFYTTLFGIEEYIFPLYASGEYHDRFFQLAALQDILFAELIGRIYTQLGTQVKMDRLILTVGSLGIWKNKIALQDAMDESSLKYSADLMLAGSYHVNKTVEAEIIRAVVSLPIGAKHKKTFPFLPLLGEKNRLKKGEGKKLQGLIWKEAQHLQQLTADWEPTDVPVLDRLLELIIQNGKSLPLLNSLHDHEILDARPTAIPYESDDS